MRNAPKLRNAEATRERILEAALAEFSAHGIAGARVDRIAQSAGCNKNLIYIYFEDKETLFTTVLMKHLMRVHEEQPFTPDDLPGYAGKLFDWAIDNPDLMRLLAWCTLEQKRNGSAERGAAFRGKIGKLAAAQQAGQVGRAFPADFLLTAIMSLGTAWSVASLFGPSLDPKLAEHPAKLRKSVIEAVRLLTNAGMQSRVAKAIKSR
ncbi:MAG TPA: TetR family transcriptional regulator [Planctomycetaceae bacterium]|jgi:AcrR family transcriptional regulator|nr:TetR family transcriptional regulator [Planctomycetaceae bacterium]